jgi:hypothetical protein
MAIHKIASSSIHEQNDNLITTSTATNNNNNNMEDIELAEPEDEPEYAEKERKRIRGIIKKLIIQLIVFLLFFCLLCCGGWAFISVTVDWLPNDCHKKGGHLVQHHNATGSHKWACEGIDGARSG